MRTLQDLPVTVELPGVLGQEVTAYVEGEAGWQVVSDGGPPHPVLALTDRPRPGPPCVVVVDGVPGHDQTRAALLAGALDVVGWPADRARLLDAPLRAQAARPTGGGARVVGVAGASGGAGTSTVCLALGGLLAWAGRRVIVVGDDDLLRLCRRAPWTGPGAAEVAALDPADARREAAALARPVAAVERLAVLGGAKTRAGAPCGTDGARDWPADVVVWDQGTRPAEADVLVARPDAGLRAAAGATVPVVLVGQGPLDGRGVRRLLGRPPLVWLPASSRVARAGLAGRVPSALPGRWLAGLRDVLGALGR